jgi:hypothetical protein
MKFKPKCLRGEIQTALTNRGHLIPCCYCDEQWVLKLPEFKKILKVSKVSEVEDIEEILYSKEWMEFEENLRLEKNIPEVCIDHCKDRGDDKIRKETCYDSTGKMVEEYNI